ncbi:hypothetical protein [Nocardioides sp. Root140]|uniref:hypothetical protein n=1 Tax=Nocardioides sp. Root140 TaxID=1736460 RepID=UPI0012E3B0A9|nr:hypothetical protein [Nocardioides sp. Root140]
MSEHYLYVACSCFRDGRTTEPPFPRAKLGFDRYGNVKLAAEKSPEDSPDGLWEWRDNKACEHHDMRLVDRIYEGSRADWDYPYVEQAIAGEGFERLRELLHRDVSGDAAIFATADEAAAGLAEMQELLDKPTGITSRVLMDPRGRVSKAIDRDGYDGNTEFTQVGAYRDYPSVRIEGVAELGIEGFEFVLREYGGKDWEHSRSQTMQVFQTGRDEIYIGGSFLQRTLFLPGEGSHPSWGLSPRLWFISGYPEPSRREPYVPELLKVELQEQRMVDLDYRLTVFRDVLEASASTGNPVVSYYSGHSLGFEQ